MDNSSYFRFDDDDDDDDDNKTKCIYVTWNFTQNIYSKSHGFKHRCQIVTDIICSISELVTLVKYFIFRYILTSKAWLLNGADVKCYGCNKHI